MICDQYRLSAWSIVAVGDGANDLPMLGIAGMGIGIRPKPIVRHSRPCGLVLGLDSLLYLIRVRDRDLNNSVERS
jgi:phosphoserine phosphatase